MIGKYCSVRVTKLWPLEIGEGGEEGETGKTGEGGRGKGAGLAEIVILYYWREDCRLISSIPRSAAGAFQT